MKNGWLPTVERKLLGSLGIALANPSIAGRIPEGISQEKKIWLTTRARYVPESDSSFFILLSSKLELGFLLQI